MSASTVTELLKAWKRGDAAAGDEVFDRVYTELRALAAARMRRERSAHTLQPTALVHEVFLRLRDAGGLAAEDRGHFLSIASRVMMRVLTDHARERRAQKRGGGELAVTLDAELAGGDEVALDAVCLREVLKRLAAIDGRKAEIVIQRFLCGATLAEVAATLGLSRKTVQREWAFSRAWLLRELAE